MKKCNCCGNEHEYVPENARPMKDFYNQFIEGYFFECQNCGSTLLHVIKQETEKHWFSERAERKAEES